MDRCSPVIMLDLNSSWSSSSVQSGFTIFTWMWMSIVCLVFSGWSRHHHHSHRRHSDSASSHSTQSTRSTGLLSTFHPVMNNHSTLLLTYDTASASPGQYMEEQRGEGQYMEQLQNQSGEGEIYMEQPQNQQRGDGNHLEQPHERYSQRGEGNYPEQPVDKSNSHTPEGDREQTLQESERLLEQNNQPQNCHKPSAGSEQCEEDVTTPLMEEEEAVDSKTVPSIAVVHALQHHPPQEEETFPHSPPQPGRLLTVFTYTWEGIVVQPHMSKIILWK